MKKVIYKIYEKRRVCNLSLEGLAGDWEPRVDTWPAVEDKISRDEIVNRFPVGSNKRRAVEMIIDEGKNFNQIYKELNMKLSEAYKLRADLQKDLAFLYDDRKREAWLKKSQQALDDFLVLLRGSIDDMSLTEFTKLYIYDYDPEAELKGWVTTKLQDTFEQIWDQNAKSCTEAPREHLKTSSVLSYIIKKISGRSYPMEIDYYHLNESLAEEKFRKIQRIVQANPVLALLWDLENVKAWSESKIELSDGSIIQPLSYSEGSVGKHPHIIILDDVIDRRVIYSDTLNQKSIDRFYSDIYPQISKDDPDKKIIIIGTAQRKDDLYNSLPADFVMQIFKAFIDEETKEVLCPELYTFEQLMKIKSDISQKHGEKYWLKEYMNTPFEAMGLIIKPEWIKRYSKLPEKRINSVGEEETINFETYTGWDLSVGKDIEKGDWTVGMTVKIDRGGDKVRIYLHSFKKGRWDFGTRLKMVVDDFGDNTPQIIGIEEVAFQYDTVKTLQNQTMLPVKGVKAISNKTESFQVELAPYFENLQVYIPEGEQWDIVVQELLSLPVGEFDDIADALKIAIKTALLQKEPEIRFV